MFVKKSCTENQNTHFFDNFFWKSCLLLDNVEKYSGARQATDENIIRCMRFACWITKATDTHSCVAKNGYANAPQRHVLVL